MGRCARQRQIMGPTCHHRATVPIMASLPTTLTYQRTTHRHLLRCTNRRSTILLYHQLPKEDLFRPDKYMITTHNLPGGLGPLFQITPLSIRKLRLIHKIANSSEISVFVEVHASDYDHRALATEFPNHYIFIDKHPTDPLVVFFSALSKAGTGRTSIPVTPYRSRLNRGE